MLFTLRESRRTSDPVLSRDQGSRRQGISHLYNIGNGAAVKSGIRVADGDILILLDGDGQHDPAGFPIKDFTSEYQR